MLHYLDNDVELRTTDSRIKGGEEDDILTEKMVRELFQVVKDHDKSLVMESNRFCYGSNSLKSLMDGQKKKFVPHLFGQNQDHPYRKDYDFVTQ